MKLAVIGGGPSAFYVVSRLLSLTQNPSLRVHLFDRHWSPHGLVRYGVAPDHPEVKNCTHKFDETATDPRFRLFSNVNVHSSETDSSSPLPLTVPLPLTSLLSNYTHLLFATGCPLPKLHPALPPSPNSISALDIVHWYTGHPSYPPPPPLENIRHVSLIGNGNVSMDVARMLLTSPSVLFKYDIPASAHAVLSRSAVEHVSIFARRGPLEAAFTTKELRELISLPEASMVPLDPSILTPSDGQNPTRQQSRILDLLRKGSKKKYGTTKKTWSLDFFRSPLNFTGNRLTLEHTAVDPSTLRAVATGDQSTIDTDLVVSSLGFQAEPGLPFYDPQLTHFRTSGGRIVSPATGTPLKNVFASGWAATGAKGVLASTMMDAYAVAGTILETMNKPTEEEEAGSGELAMATNPHPEDPPEEIIQGLRQGAVLEYPDWKRIDAEEIRKGQAFGRERQRMSYSEARIFLGR